MTHSQLPGVGLCSPQGAAGAKAVLLCDQQALREPRAPIRAPQVPCSLPNPVYNKAALLALI